MNSTIIEIAGMKITVTKKRIKNLHLYVKRPLGNVEVSAPLRMSSASIALFVQTKLDWIRKQQEKVKEKSLFVEPEYVTGDTLYLWGKGYRLEVKYSGRTNSLVFVDEIAVLTLKEGCTEEQKKRWLKEWYRVQLKVAVAQYLPKWEAITDLHPSSWQIKDMTTRWGTCNTRTRKIWINLQLAKRPLFCLEYIILHEIVHLRVSNHGKDFVALMDKFMPQWREIRRSQYL